MILSERHSYGTNAGKGLLSVAHQRFNRFRGLLKNPQIRGGINRKPHRQPTNLHLPAITETDQESFSTLGSSEILATTRKFEAITELLSSPNADLNRIGMQRLTALTKSRVDGLASHFQASHVILYGGEPEEEKLRNLLLSFVRYGKEDESRDERETTIQQRFPDTDDDSASMDSIEEEDSMDPSLDSAEGGSARGGQEYGAFHLQALHVVANSLEQIMLSSDATDALPLDFTESFWRQVIGTICCDIEWCHPTEVTGWSLKVLRLLHTFEPSLVTPLLRHTLLPYLAHLEGSGEQYQLHMVETEAAKLMRRADTCPSTRFEI